MSGHTDLERFTAMEHVVLVRVRGQDQGLLAVLPHLPGQSDALRILHGVQDRDGLVGAEQAKKGLQALQGLSGAPDQPMVALLEQVEGTGPLRLEVITSPVQGLMARITQRAGSREDTESFIDLLNAGDIRAAEKVGNQWEPQPYVIDGILNYFGAHGNVRMGAEGWDKVPLRITHLSDETLEASGVRYAPGCQIRTGCFIGSGTVIMNQAFVNIGAYVAGEGVMIDVSSRVASCAQIGRNVKFGAGSGIEGILEPAGRLPSIVEDHAKIGAMCEISGIVGEGAVLASGVVMASGKKIYDEESGQTLAPLEMDVGGTVYQIPVIPPYRLAVGGSLISTCGKFATDAVILKPGDLRDGDTLKHFEKQGILYQ